MRKIHLNGREFIDKDTAHTILKDKLQLPDYYGRNLDALWDVLSTDFSEKMIVIQDPQVIKANLGRYGSALIHLFEELNDHNDATTVVYAYTIKNEESGTKGV